ncbi:hypothetical protein RhiirB3_435473 [Rhizophagus irregularis]|nr:hypothetical protein RhiirB3_435473 [Rhizophagus irregularis]
MFPWTEGKVINPENIQGVTEHDVKEMINNTSANNESYYGNEHEKDDEIT